MLKKVCRHISDLISKIVTMFISLDASLHVYSTEEWRNVTARANSHIKDSTPTVLGPCRIAGIYLSRLVIIRVVAEKLRNSNSPQLYFYCCVLSIVEATFMKLRPDSNQGHFIWDL